MGQSPPSATKLPVPPAKGDREGSRLTEAPDSALEPKEALILSLPVSEPKHPAAAEPRVALQNHPRSGGAGLQELPGAAGSGWLGPEVPSFRPHRAHCARSSRRALLGPSSVMLQELTAPRPQDAPVSAHPPGPLPCQGVREQLASGRGRHGEGEGRTLENDQACT